MKILTEAPQQDFNVYIARPETIWIEQEPGDQLAFIYESGHLPYSGADGLQGIFYSARSARITLKEFQLSSENRRIAKKFDGHFTKEKVADFKPDEAFYEFSTNYFAEKHGTHSMPTRRLETIMESGLISNTTIYRSIRDESIVAYVLEVRSGTMGHYWFSFYDLQFARQSLGLWLMLDSIRDAKADGLIYYYLGTVYGEKALYKMNFEPVEWWNGSSWQHDTAALKKLARKD